MMAAWNFLGSIWFMAGHHIRICLMGSHHAVWNTVWEIVGNYQGFQPKMTHVAYSGFCLIYFIFNMNTGICDVHFIWQKSSWWKLELYFVYPLFLCFLIFYYIIKIIKMQWTTSYRKPLDECQQFHFSVFVHSFHDYELSSVF